MFFDRTFKSLMVKEYQQMMRDKQILAMLLVTPTLQMVMYGFALSPDVRNLRLGVVDQCCTNESRELTAQLVNNGVFDIMRHTGKDTAQLYKSIDDGDLDAGVVIPPDYQRNIAKKQATPVEVVLNAVDANTAGIAGAYIAQIILAFSRTLKPAVQAISPQITYLYNPGLLSSWFFVPAVMSMSLTIAGTMVSLSTLLREKESGTIEQLLMAPASATQILVAKITPLIAVLFGVLLFSLTLGMTIFGVPFRGDFLLFVISSLDYMFVLIALGLMMATYAANQRQAMLSTFFIMMPLIQLSGALAPVESMPEFFKLLSNIDPLKFYILCMRGVLIKGNGFPELWPNLLALFIFAVVFMSVSASRFRKQLM